MAVPAIDATPAGPGANSYVTEAEAVAYLAIRPGAPAWTEPLTDDARRALLFAALLLDRETFWGQPSTAMQALAFPRAGMAAVPADVKTAQIEQALDIAAGDYLRRLDLLDLQDAGVRQVRTASVSQQMVPSTPNGFPLFKLCGWRRSRRGSPDRT